LKKKRIRLWYIASRQRGSYGNEREKCLKKREFTYRHKGQVLIQVRRDKREVKLDFNTTQSRMWDRKEETEG